MKIYTKPNIEARSSVEILLNYKELKGLISALKTFEEKIQRFKALNMEQKSLEFTHLHLKDCGLIEEKSKSDIVFYVDLDNE